MLAHNRTRSVPKILQEREGLTATKKELLETTVLL